jgi:Rod binding domain-containing protein
MTALGAVDLSAGLTTSDHRPGLERSAHEFEASLMAELLKPLQEEESNDGGMGSSGALAGFASESLAKAISEHGGFGIADRILHSFAAHQTSRTETPVRGGSPRPG